MEIKTVKFVRDGYYSAPFVFGGEDAPAFIGYNISDYMTVFENLGYKPEQVTKILLTHKHSDHSGCIDKFPNAKIYVNEDELGAEELKGKSNIVPVKFTSGAYHNFPESEKIADNIYFIKAKGHTYGNSIVIVENDGLYYMIHGDITFKTVSGKYVCSVCGYVYDSKTTSLIQNHIEQKLKNVA